MRFFTTYRVFAQNTSPKILCIDFNGRQDTKYCIFFVYERNWSTPADVFVLVKSLGDIKVKSETTKSVENIMQ